MDYGRIGFGKKVHIIDHVMPRGDAIMWALCGLSEYPSLIVPKPKDDEQLCKNCMRIQAKDDRGL